MIQELLPGFYWIQIALPEYPMQSVNNYYIQGKARSLWVDTAFADEAALVQIEAAAEELQVDWNNTDFLITHGHADHYGLVHRLVKEGCRNYISRLESESFQKFFAPIEVLCSDLAHFLQENSPTLLQTFDWQQEIIDYYGWHPDMVQPPLTFLEDGDVLSVGNYQFRCMIVPGHTGGHLCLYEETWQILLCGDCILQCITPTLLTHREDEYLLDRYFQSLITLGKLPVKLVLPGHRALVTDLPQRLEQIFAFAEKRMVEILTALGTETLTGYEITLRLKWGRLPDRFYQVPPIYQGYIYVSDTLSYIYALEAQGKIAKYKDSGVIRFRATSVR